MPFHTTRWSLVLSAGTADEEASRAFDELCALYWTPVYAFYRQLGSPQEEAEDLTQGLFLHLLSTGDVQKAEPQRGRFRSYLRTCARNFATSQARAERAQKRGGDLRRRSIDIADVEGRPSFELVDHETPEQAFERHFARALVGQVLERMALEAHERGKGEHFDALRCYLEVDGGPPFRDKAQTLGMGEGAVRVAVHRLRERFRELLLVEVRHTLADPAEALDEIDQLLEALAGPKKPGGGA